MFNSSLAQEMTAYIELRSAAFSNSLVSNDKRVLLDTDKYMRFSGVQVPESLDVFETFTAGLIQNVEVPYEEE